MVTAYDYPSAQIAEAAGVDVVLVGDSAAMTVLGHESTVPVTVDEMLMLTAAVRRGLSTPLLVADLPFGSYEVSDEQAVATAQRFVKTTGVRRRQDRARRLVGRPRPRDHRRRHPRDGPRRPHPADGRDHRRLPVAGTHRRGGARRLRERRSRCRPPDASRSCSRPSRRAVTDADHAEDLDVPVIGIGAGPGTDGQVLVFHDILGIYDGHAARFVKRYADLRSRHDRGGDRVRRRGRARAYPQPEHGYGMAPEEAARLRALCSSTRMSTSGSGCRPSRA